MKRILNLILTLCFVMNTYCVNYEMKSTSPYQQHQVQQSVLRIGYTTQYGNGFNANPTYGYPQQTTYQGVYTPQVSAISEPRKAAKSSGGSVTVDGVTVTYTVDGLIVGWVGFAITIYNPDGTIAHQETVWKWGESSAVEYAKSLAREYAKEWAESHAVPIGDAVMPLLILAMCYIGHDVLIKPEKTT